MYYVNFGAASEGDGLFTRAPVPTAIDRAQNPERIQAALAENVRAYQREGRKNCFTAGAFEVSVYSHREHRSVLVETTDKEAMDKLRGDILASIYEVKNKKGESLPREYSMLSFNCVTAVAKTINLIQPGIVSDGLVLPTNLDSQVSAYIKLQELEEKDGREALFEPLDEQTVGSLESYRETQHQEKDLLNRIKQLAEERDSDTESQSTDESREEGGERPSC
jgi:hypothetical protein